MEVANMNGSMSEKELREFSQALGSLIPKKGENLDDEAFLNLVSSFRRVIHTASSAKLSLTHGAAAWNSLYGFLEQGISSSHRRLRNLCFASETWVEVYELFLAKSQSNKSKPMKQVLLTLTKVLMKNPLDSVQLFLARHVVSTTALKICDHDDFPSVKPAFHVLEHFINKGILRASEIIFQLARKSSFHGQTRLSDFAVEESDLHDYSTVPQHLQVSIVRKFITDVLAWVRYPDVAPISGRLVVAFLKSLQACSIEDEENPHFEEDPQLWVKPVIDLLEHEPSLFNVFECHIIPGLLKLNLGHTQPFLDTNLLQDLLDGNSEKHSDVDIQLCLLALKLRMEVYASKNPGHDHFKVDHDIKYELQEIALALIGHASASIRITALSLIAHHPAPTEPFSPHVLECLQQFIPFFHTEVNPRVRNEFIVTMKKICARLERGFLFTSENNKSSQYPPTLNLASEASDRKGSDYKDISSQKHVSFSKMYIGFLTQELQPTASYQRHITALKILEFMLVEGLIRNDRSKLFHPSKIVDGDFAIARGRQFFSSCFVRLIAALVMDPFDDVRLIASKLLQFALWNQYPWNTSSWTRETEQFIDPGIDYLRTLSRRTYHTYILEVVCQAESIMYRTGRADHADSVGKLYYLLHESCQNFTESTINTFGMSIAWSSTGWSIIDHLVSELKRSIITTRQDIRLAVGSAPLHGALIALRNIIGGNGFYDLHSTTDPGGKFRRGVNNSILACCIEVWEVVKDVLCYDSPEGYTLEDDEDNDSDVGTKDILSFSWRALKESSALMNLMVTVIPYSPESSLGLRYSDLQTIGDLAFSQLAELRHRGAFSTVSQTFSSSCKRFVEVDYQSGRVIGQSIRNLPKKWYQDALGIIERNASALTRRSAGLPSILVGVLSAFPEGDFFDDIILNLQKIARAPVESGGDPENPRLPQVHALNCLKDIFVDTRLGPGTELHMADTLDIATNCLESDRWALRNCGLMLFKALISRLNGGTDTASTKVSSSHRRFSRLVYEQYPNLPKIIRRLFNRMDPTSNNDNQLTKEDLYPQQAQRVFLALEIVGRSGLPPEYCTEIQKIIREQMEGSIWAIRDKAARTLSLLIDEKDFNVELTNLLDSGWKTHNVLHGRLLCAQLLVSQIGRELKDDLESLLPLFISSFDSFVARNNCPFTAAAYIDFVTNVLDLLLKQNCSSATRFANMLKDCISISGIRSKTTFNNRSSALLRDALKRCVGSIYHSSTSRSWMANGVLVEASMILEYPDCETEHFPKPKFDEAVTVRQLSSSLDQTSISGSIVGSFIETEEEEYRRNGTPSQEQDHNANLSDLLRSSQMSSIAKYRTLRNPEKQDDDLRASGITIGTDYFQEIQTWKGQETFTTWVCKLSLAIDERSELSNRLAAVDSISCFVYALKDQEFTMPYTRTLFGVFLVLYDALLDDDEDVRDKAAATTSILHPKVTNNKPIISLSPSVAAQKLIQFLICEFGDSKILIAEATHRLIGPCSLFKLGPVRAAIPEELSRNNELAISEVSEIDEVPFVSLRPFKEMLCEAAKQDDLLFVEERQNLFIDPVRESDNWAEVLMRAHPCRRTGIMIREFDTWILDGLTALIRAIGVEDGPFGWTSKFDGFTLGVRIILAAKVQLHWTRYMPFREAISLKIRERLIDLDTGGNNGLWFQRIREILRDTS